MGRGIIWSVIILSVFVLTGCQKKVKEEAQPIEVQAVSLDEATPAAATAAPGTEQMAPGQISTAVGATAGAITNVAANAATAVEETVSAASGAYEKPSIEKIQEALKNAGFYSGSIDGKLGPKTKDAIETFQTQNNLNADGKVGPKTWARLSAYLTSQATTTSAPISEPASQVGY